MSAIVLWLLIALLPLNGYANAMANGCASHRQPASAQRSMPMVHHHAGMDMVETMDMAATSAHAGMHHAAAPTHGNCHCSAICLAQCAGNATLASLSADFSMHAMRNETPAAAGIAATRPSPVFDLLRPPKTRTL